MKTTSFPTLYAAILLAGLIFAGVGGWGTWYFSSKTDGEKENERALEEQQLNDQIFSLKQANEELLRQNTLLQSIASLPPIPSTGHVRIGSPEPKASPALITSESGSSAPPPSPSASQPNGSWNLGDKQRQKIVDSLSKHAGKTITICSVESDTEGLAFAGSLKRIFEEAGWHVDGVKQVIYSKPPSGLNLVCGAFPAPEGAIATYRAFAAAGFHVSQQLDAKLAGEEAELIVGGAQ